MRKKGRPKKQNDVKIIKVPGKRGRPRKKETVENEPLQKKAKRGRPRTIKVEHFGPEVLEDPLNLASTSRVESHVPDLNDSEAAPEEIYSEGLHMSTMQVRSLSSLVACLECGEEVVLGVRPTTKGMISEFTVTCKVCDSQKSTNTPNLIRERKRKREKKGATLQKNENINYAHVAAFLDNGLGYSGLRHYCRYFSARCLNEATFIVYAKQVISDVVLETEDFLQQNARIVRKAFESQLESDFLIDLTVGYTTTYHQWGSDFCLVAGAVIELQTGLVLDYDVGNMYCHVCKINAKKIVSMSPSEMTEWFNRHQDTCEIREWCDEIDQDSEEGIREIDPKYLEAFIAKKIWSRSLEKFGFRYTILIHESDERIHSELLKAAPYGDIPVIIDNITNCFSRRKSEHARTSFQNKLKAKCPRERVQTKDRIMYVYAMSIPEYNKFAIGSNIKLRELVRRMEIEEEEYATPQASEILPTIRGQVIGEEKLEAKEVGDAFEVEKEQDGTLEEEVGDEEEMQENDIEVLEELEEEEEEEEEEEDEEGEDEEIEEAARKISNKESAVEHFTAKEIMKQSRFEKNGEAKEITLTVQEKQSILSSGSLDQTVSQLDNKKNEQDESVAKGSVQELEEKVTMGKERLNDSKSNTEDQNSSGTGIDQQKIIVISTKPASATDSNQKRVALPLETRKEDLKDFRHISQKYALLDKPYSAKAIKTDTLDTPNAKETLLEKKEDKNDETLTNESQRQEPLQSGTDRISIQTKMVKNPSENGTDVGKTNQIKQSEVIKPFRVEYDED